MTRNQKIRPEWDQYFLDICEAVSKRSHDAETSVGVVITNNKNRIISTGYNGFSSGIDDSNLPNLRPAKYEYMVHAETNAIFGAFKYSDLIQEFKSSILYSTHSPCHSCAKEIILSGIKKVVYRVEYGDKHKQVLDYLKKCGVFAYKF